MRGGEYVNGYLYSSVYFSGNYGWCVHASDVDAKIQSEDNIDGVDPAYLDGVTGINNRTMIMAVSAEAALVIVYMCILQIWNLIRDRRLIRGYLPTLLLPISQFCFSAGANLSAVGHSDSYSIAFFLGAILGFCLDIYWMYELLYRSRRTEAEQELREIAEMYGGTYQTEYREQIFTALVSMELKKVYES